MGFLSNHIEHNSFIFLTNYSTTHTGVTDDLLQQVKTYWNSLNLGLLLVQDENEKYSQLTKLCQKRRERWMKISTNSIKDFIHKTNRATVLEVSKEANP